MRAIIENHSTTRVSPIIDILFQRPRLYHQLEIENESMIVNTSDAKIPPRLNHGKLCVMQCSQKIGRYVRIDD